MSSRPPRKSRLHYSCLDEDLDVSSSDDDSSVRVNSIAALDEDSLLRDEDEDVSQITGTNDMEVDSDVTSAQNAETPSTRPLAPSPVEDNHASPADGSKEDDKDSEETDNTVADIIVGLPNSTFYRARGNRSFNRSLDEICKEKSLLLPRECKDPASKPVQTQESTQWRGSSSGPDVNQALDDIIKRNRFAPHFRRGGRGGIFGVMRQNKDSRHTHSSPRSYDKKGGDSQGRFYEGMKALTQQTQGFDVDAALRNKDVSLPGSPWNDVVELSKKGFPLSLQMSQRKSWDYHPEEMERRFKHVVKLQDNVVGGVCEAGNRFHAKQGSSANFLEKFSKTLPQPGNYTTEVDESLLVKSVDSLVGEIEKQLGPDFKYRFFVSTGKVNSRKLHKAVMQTDCHRFEGLSFISTTMSKIVAAKEAYKHFLKKPIPVGKIFVGETECTTPDEEYEPEEFEKIKTFEFASLQNSDTVPQPQVVVGGRGRAGMKGCGPLMLRYENPDSATIYEDPGDE